MGKKITTRADQKRCSRCGEWKPIKGWPRNSALADGLAAYCRACKRAADRDAKRSPAAGDVSGVSKAAPTKKADPAPSSRPSRGPGRPSKITRELIAQLCEVLSRGHTRRAAAAKAGIADSTLFAWLADGREPDATGLKRELYEAVIEAEGLGEFTLVEIVRESAEIDPAYAKWLLERRHHLDWARREQVAVTGEGGKPMEVTVVRELVAKRITGLLAAPVEIVPPPPPTEEAHPSPDGDAPREPA